MASTPSLPRATRSTVFTEAPQPICMYVCVCVCVKINPKKEDKTHPHTQVSSRGVLVFQALERIPAKKKTPPGGGFSFDQHRETERESSSKRARAPQTHTHTHARTHTDTQTQTQTQTHTHTHTRKTNTHTHTCTHTHTNTQTPTATERRGLIGPARASRGSASTSDRQPATATQPERKLARFNC